MDREALRCAVAAERLRWRQHALDRMRQRGVSITAYEPGLDRFEPGFRIRRH
jgi:hypothetical protein